MSYHRLDSLKLPGEWMLGWGQWPPHGDLQWKRHSISSRMYHPDCTNGNARPPNRTTDVLKACAFKRKSSSKTLCCAVHCGNLVTNDQLQVIVKPSDTTRVHKPHSNISSVDSSPTYRYHIYNYSLSLILVSWWRIRSQIVVLHMWWFAYHDFSSPKLVAVVTCSIGNKQSAHNRPPHPQ